MGTAKKYITTHTMQDIKIIKKSVNITGDIMEQIDNIVRKNPGLSFTVIVSQALRQWLQNPTIEVNVNRDEFNMEEEMEKKKDILDELAK